MVATLNTDAVSVKYVAFIDHDPLFARTELDIIQHDAFIVI
jgi:hypothetical protein